MGARRLVILSVFALASFHSSLSSAQTSRVVVCGVDLCRYGAPWHLDMGTVYNGLDKPADSVTQVLALGLNTIRITDFLDVDGPPDTAPYDETHWRKVDELIAAASAAHLAVELDLSTYRNLLKMHRYNPYTQNWAPFLHFVVNRRNSVTGVRYGDDPTIAIVAFAGEVDAINGGDNTYGLTTNELTTFFDQVERYWHAAAPRQILTAGGLTQLAWNSGIDWQAIFRLPYNSLAAIHVYSAHDRDLSLPSVAAYSSTLHKPWITEEFGFPASIGDGTRAVLFSMIYALNRRYGSAGTGFWNVGHQVVNTYDVGSQTPLTFDVVRSQGPR